MIVLYDCTQQSNKMYCHSSICSEVVFHNILYLKFKCIYIVYKYTTSHYSNCWFFNHNSNLLCVTLFSGCFPLCHIIKLI